MEFVVLVLEDDLAQLAIRSMLLREHGFSVVEATTVESALAAALRNRPHCVVLDLRLPREKDGLQLLQRLKLADPQRPVYVLTGAGLKSMATRPELQACDGVFQKGTSILTLVDALKTLRR